MLPSMRRLCIVSVVGVTLVLAVHVPLPASSAMITPAPLATPRAANGGPMTTCDGTAGYFACPAGDRCYFDMSGSFGCCPRSVRPDKCRATQNCANYGGDCMGQPNCISCTESDAPSCYVFINEGMSQMRLTCGTATTPVFATYMYDRHTSRMRIHPSQLTEDPFASSPPTNNPAGASTSLGPLETAPASRAATSHPTPENYIQQTKSNLPGSTIGGIAAGTLAAGFALSLCGFLLYKWYKTRKLKRQLADFNNGVLPGPRRIQTPPPANSDGCPKGVRNGYSVQIRGPMSPKYDLDGASEASVGPHSFHTYTTPTRPAKPSPSKYSLYPQGGGSFGKEAGLNGMVKSPSSVYSRCIEEPIVAPPTAKSTEARDVQGARSMSPSASFPNFNGAPPVTPPPRPAGRLSGNWPLGSTPVGASPSRSSSVSKIMQGPPGPPPMTPPPHLPSPIEEHKRKSSLLSSVGGPFMTAEMAVGDGYWEAEREQVEADRAMREAIRAAETLGGGDDDELKEEIVAANDFGGEDDLGQIDVEVSENGTVIRRRSSAARKPF